MAAQQRITARDQMLGMAFASPWLIGFTVFLLLPIGMSLYYSFTLYDMNTPPVWIGPDNFRRLLGDAVFYRAVFNTLIYAACSVPLTLGGSLLLAVLLNRPVPGQGFFRTAVFLPTLTPAVAAAMIWLVMLNGKRGVVNQWLAAMHVAGPAWLEDPKWIMATLVVLSLWGIGNAVVIFLAGLQDIPVELYEAAQIDGATGVSRFWHITVPMLSPVIFYNMIMGIIASWQIFTLPRILVDQKGDRAGYFYSNYIVDAAFKEQRFGDASAMAWILFLILMGLTLAVVLAGRRWVHTR